jgi:hypothetical protein
LSTAWWLCQQFGGCVNSLLYVLELCGCVNSLVIVNS